MALMRLYWHLIGRAAHREDMLGPLPPDAFNVGSLIALPVEGDLVTLHLPDKDSPVQLRVKRRRFDFLSAEPELHIDLELISN
jgi:hypothetical protein